jgi:LPPG:FO 2-phospho-L-lactate transferase
MISQVTCLAGGVGAARFLQGLRKVVPEENITVIVNTGDDIELHGLHISPDPDIILYTLANIVDEEKGWGIKGDTFHCLETLQKLGCETWFKLGDRDLATHIYRTNLLKQGYTLTEVTKNLCRLLEVKVRILPMTDDKVETKIITDKGAMHFQEYLVKRKAQDKVVKIVYENIEKAQPSKEVIESILKTEAVLICPSNPVVSIGTILSLKGIKEALVQTKAKIAAISPIVGGAPVKGPADKLMRGLGLEVSAYSVAYLYRDFLDIFILDNKDEKEKQEIEKLGITVFVTNTLMKSLKDKMILAKKVLKSLQQL